MKTILDKFKVKSFFILFLFFFVANLFCFYQVAKADNQFKVRVLSISGFGQDKTTLRIRSLDGVHKIQLNRIEETTQPLVTIASKSSLLIKDKAAYYEGKDIFTNNPATAMLFRDKLTVNVTSKNGRALEFKVDNKSNTGTLKHYPKSLKVALEKRLNSDNQVWIEKNTVKNSPLHINAQLLNTNDAKNSPIKVVPVTVNYQKEVELGAEVDYEWYTAEGSDADAITAGINSTITKINNIYKTQLGLTFKLKKINIWDRSSDPYVETESKPRLDEFKNYTNSNAQISGDVKHLFTGVNTTYDGDSAVVGLAFQRDTGKGVVCYSPSFAYSFSERLSSTVRHLVTAHEIGHNFGADHDEDTISLMSPFLNTSNPQFSDKSIGHIQSHVDAYSSCLSASTDDGSGGSGGGTGGGGDTPVTLKPKLTFTASVKNRSILTVNLTAKDDSAVGCKVKLYGATKKTNLSGDFSKAVMMLETTGKAKDVVFSLSSKTIAYKPTSSVYLVGQVVCGEYSAVSSVKTITTKTFNGRKATPSTFIAYLKTKLKL